MELEEEQDDVHLLLNRLFPEDNSQSRGGGNSIAVARKFCLQGLFFPLGTSYQSFCNLSLCLFSGVDLHSRMLRLQRNFGKTKIGQVNVLRNLQLIPFL